MTIGYELEFFGANLFDMAKKYHIPYKNRYEECNYLDFTLKQEYMISANGNGGELISPIYFDLKLCKTELKEKLKMLHLNGAFLKENSQQTGFHIHLGRNIFQIQEQYEALLKFLFVFQNELYFSAKGRDESVRFNVYTAAAPLTKEKITLILKRMALLNYYLYEKDSMIRFTKDTLEFRLFNSSLYEDVLFYFLELIFSLGRYIALKKYDLDYLNYYYGKALEVKEELSMTKYLELHRILGIEKK